MQTDAPPLLFTATERVCLSAALPPRPQPAGSKGLNTSRARCRDRRLRTGRVGHPDEHPITCLADLPFHVLELVMTPLLAATRDGGSIRRVCRSFRHAHDACTSHLTFTHKPASHSSEGPQRDEAQMAVIRASPRLDSLTLSGHGGLGWAAALQAGGPALCGRLRTLRVVNRGEVNDLSPLSSLVSLTDLELSGCSKLVQLGQLSACAALTRLDLCRCVSLADLAPLAGLAAHGALLRLCLRGCTSISDIGPLSAFACLRSLDLAQSAVHDLSPLATCSSLRQMDISQCSRVSSLASLADLPVLQHLSYHGLATPALVSDMQLNPALTHLDFSRSLVPDLQLLPSALLRHLRHLDLASSPSLADIRALENASSLQRLSVAYCYWLNTNPDALRPLRRCSALTDLDLSGLWNQSLCSPPCSLRRLNLSHTNISYLYALQNCTGLQTLNLRGCRQVADLSPLSGLTGLQTLHLSRHCTVTNLQPLAKAPAVKIVWAE